MSTIYQTREERIKLLENDLEETNNEAMRLRDLRFKHRFLASRSTIRKPYQECKQNKQHAIRRLAALYLRITQLQALIARA